MDPWVRQGLVQHAAISEPSFFLGTAFSLRVSAILAVVETVVVRALTRVSHSFPCAGSGRRLRW